MKRRSRLACLAVGVAGLASLAGAQLASGAEACWYTGGGCGNGTVAGGGGNNGYWTGVYYDYGFKIYSAGPHYDKGGWVSRDGQGILGPWYGGSGATSFTKTFALYQNQRHLCGNFGPASMSMHCAILL